MTSDQCLREVVQADKVGLRLDQWLVAVGWVASRNQGQRAINAGRVRVNGRPEPASHRLQFQDRVEIDPVGESPRAPSIADIAPLSIVYEDDRLLVVDKPAGLVVHPAPSLHRPTLADALARRLGPTVEDVGGPGRCGLVHRLDRQTSGLLLAAKDESTHEALKLALAARRIHRRYLALACGSFAETSGEIDKPVGRRRSDRKRMGVEPQGRPGRTSFLALLQRDGVSLLLIGLHTGRTHQIRVHFQSIGRPLLGDLQYGWSKRQSLARMSPLLRSRLGPVFPRRQMLHAAGLGFAHPWTGQALRLLSAPPEDFRQTLEMIFGSVLDLAVEAVRAELERIEMARPSSTGRPS